MIIITITDKETEVQKGQVMAHIAVSKCRLSLNSGFSDSRAQYGSLWSH